MIEVMSIREYNNLLMDDAYKELKKVLETAEDELIKSAQHLEQAREKIKDAMEKRDAIFEQMRLDI